MPITYIIWVIINTAVSIPLKDLHMIVTVHWGFCGQAPIPGAYNIIVFLWTEEIFMGKRGVSDKWSLGLNT